MYMYVRWVPLQFLANLLSYSNLWYVDISRYRAIRSDFPVYGVLKSPV